MYFCTIDLLLFLLILINDRIINDWILYYTFYFYRISGSGRISNNIDIIWWWTEVVDLDWDQHRGFITVIFLSAITVSLAALLNKERKNIWRRDEIKSVNNKLADVFRVIKLAVNISTTLVKSYSTKFIPINYLLRKLTAINIEVFFLFF